MNTLESVITIIGLACISVISRGFFLWPNRPVTPPHWLKRGLRIAPLAAIIAVIAPEVLLIEGRLITSLMHPPLIGTAVCIVSFQWKRNVLISILSGLASALAASAYLGS